MISDEQLKQLRELLAPIQEDIKSIYSSQKRMEGTVEDNQTHTNTALNALKAGVEDLQKGQEDIRRDMATKDDIHWLANKIDKQKKRIENLEESTETPNPFKH